MPLPRAVRGRPVLLTACIGLPVVLLVLLLLHWRLPAPVALEYGEATTVIDGPLDADGFPDYVAYLSALRGPLPPGDRNAAPELLDLLSGLTAEPSPWPAEFGPRPAGARATPPADILDDADRAAALDTALDEDPDPAAWPEPVRADLARVLEAERAAIERFVAAAARPSCRMPPAPEVPGEPRLPEFADLPTFELMAFARLVLADGATAARAGRIETAIERIESVRRLARLVRRDGDSDISRLVAIAIEDGALRTLTVVARMPELDPQGLRALLANGRALAALPPPAVDPAERVRLRAAAVTLTFAREVEHETRPGEPPLFPTVDVNAALRTALVAAEEPPSERSDPPKAWAGPFVRVVLGGRAFRDHNTRLLEWLGRHVVARPEAEEERSLRASLARSRLLALELVDRLRSQDPNDPAAVARGDEALDPFCDGPFRSRTDDGVTLRWSVGPDGVDGGGSGDDVLLDGNSN